jgi:hypothetical protein
MRYILTVVVVLILILVLIGCNNKEKQASSPKDSNNQISQLISLLEKNGYYKYIDPSMIEKVKKESIEAGYVYGWEDSGRDFSSDAESLAEGGVSEFFESIKEFLVRQNVVVKVSEEDFDDEDYKITVNGVQYEIYSKEEAQTDEIWELSTIRSFAIVNKLLKNAGSSERLYILYGGNDLRCVFLTDEMYNLISENKSVSKKEQAVKVPEVFN